MIDLSIIGFGNFGKFIAGILKEYFNIYIYDINITDELKKKFNYNFISVEIALSKKLIVIAIPSQFIEDFLKKNKKYINKNAIFIDVCSVKIKPLQIMEKYLYLTNKIIGTHPLFGPNSAKNNIAGHKIVICPIRIKKINPIIQFMKKKLQLDVIIKTPEEHDKEMAMIQGLSHFLAKALDEIGLRDSDVKTISFDYLLKMTEILKHDTQELFNTIENENPYAKDIREALISKLIEINNELNFF